MLLLGVGQPLDQASLVDELDTPTAFARIEKLLVLCPLPATYPASIWILEVPPLSFGVGIVGGVIHQVRKRRLGRKFRHLIFCVLHVGDSVVRRSDRL